MKTHSCCTALLKITEDWRNSIDNKEAIAAVAVDLSKAFDAINHSLLLAKLKAYGFSPHALELMFTYLLGRQQCVRLEGLCSNFKTVKSGVPQGSLLGPLLFNIFVNDLNFCVPNVSLRLYADDTTAYLSDVSPTILEFSFNKDLQTLSWWFESNHLTVNSTKTQALSVGIKVPSLVCLMNMQSPRTLTMVVRVPFTHLLLTSMFLRTTFAPSLTSSLSGNLSLWQTLTFSWSVALGGLPLSSVSRWCGHYDRKALFCDVFKMATKQPEKPRFMEVSKTIFLNCSSSFLW